MARLRSEHARRIRDSNAILILVFLAMAISFGPFVALVTNGPSSPTEPVLLVSWWTGAVTLVGYGTVHLLAALADAGRFRDDYGTEYASVAVVFCHALGQRLLVVVSVGFALVLLSILGTGVGIPFVLLAPLGSFGAVLLGPPTAIPMNRRVSERLGENRHG
ncbi:hypothetical protein SAMN05216564_101159 [Halopenitus persicus]|uniref:Uncharacterized protein n=2 Tax=Halopenitus persicus TaxID=1048396 RepID=A0A1H3DWY8_9EURY|nr:hypothetical protein SAMN05216564_101159 [Halopenitus persicus]